MIVFSGKRAYVYNASDHLKINGVHIAVDCGIAFKVRSTDGRERDNYINSHKHTTRCFLLISSFVYGLTPNF